MFVLQFFSKAFTILKTRGLPGFFMLVDAKVANISPAIYKQARNIWPIRTRYKESINAFANKRGLEFGGPSAPFSLNGIYPIYNIVSSVDNCSYKSSTLWQGITPVGQFFHYSKLKDPGYQYNFDTCELDGISSSSYDFICSSHMLEHCSNPLLHLKHCMRILKDNGLLLIILPHKDATFDRFRQPTNIIHMISDFENCINEHDKSHFLDIISNHDIANDGFIQKTGDTEFMKDQLIDRLEQNFENRFAHHHVFTTQTALELVDHAGFKVEFIEPIKFNNIILLAKKSRPEFIDNDAFFAQNALWRRFSPFPSDRIVF